MRKLNVLLLAAVVVVAVPAVVQANGGGSQSGKAAASSTSLVTVNVPGVVGIDIESDMTIDLTSYMTSGVAGGACGSIYPPAMGCTGAADYPATGNTTTSGVPTPPDPTANEMWMAVFCNKTTGALGMTAYAGDNWNSGAPFTGSTPQNLQFKAAAANNTPGVGGGGTYSAFGTGSSKTTVPLGGLTGTFGWTRVDQAIQLDVPNASSVTFTPGTYTATVTYTINKS